MNDLHVPLHLGRKLWRNNRRPRIALVVCPYEGEVVDRVTHRFYKPSAVKYMPLGLLSLAANLREYEVCIIDASSRGMGVEQTLDEIAAFAPDVLGLSVVTYRAWAMQQLLDRADVPIKVVGGPHATRNHPYIIAQGADAVFVGDAEVSFPRWLEQGCPAGVFHAAPTELNEIPLPARDLVDLDHYRIEGRENLLFDAGPLRLPMYSSKGCPLRCNYCDVQQKTHIVKSPARMLEEFRDMLRVGATSIHILDDAFNIKRDRVREFCDLVEQAGIFTDWSVRGVVEVRESVMAALSRAGCKRFHVGIEHLDDEVLAFFRKSQRFRHVQQFCGHARQHDIDLLAYFIIGAPGETDAYRQRLPELIEDLGVAIPYFNVLTPLSETDYYADMLKAGVFKADFWDAFCRAPVKDFEIPSHRSRAEENELAACLESYIAHFSAPREVA